MKTIVQNGSIITPHRMITNGGVLIEGSKIIRVFEGAVEVPTGVSLVDAGGRIICPGFVDIHVHGGGGHEVMGASPAEINDICAAHSKYGTTSMLPTTLAAPIDDICATIDSIRSASDISKTADILGVHLEGPYFALSQRGAQAPEYIITPSPECIHALLDRWDGVRMMGAAPEIEGGLALGGELTRRGIIASVAHSDATFGDIERALDHGYSDITHIYSGCSHVHRVEAYRVAGVVEAGLFFDSMSVQVIADGKHLPPALLRLIYKCKGPDKIALITDAMAPAATDLQEGASYTLSNGLEMILDDGVMKLPCRTSFAGSCATMHRLVQNMITLANVPLIDAVKMASLTPARIIGAHHKGCIAPGFDADILIVDADVNVHMTMVRGRVVYG